MPKPGFHRKRKFKAGDNLLDKVTADWLSAVDERLNRLEKLQVVPPLRKQETSFGDVLSVRSLPGGGSQLLRAKVRFNFCSSDETIQVCNVEFYGDFAGETPTEINNVLNYAAERGKLIQAVYRRSTQEWDVLDIEHTDREYLERMEFVGSSSSSECGDLISSGGDAEDTTCDFRFKRLTTPMIKAPLAGEPGPEFQCDPANPSSSSSGGDPNICVVAAYDVLSFVPKAFITSLDDNQGSIDANLEIAWTPQVCCEDTDTIPQNISTGGARIVDTTLTADMCGDTPSVSSTGVLLPTGEEINIAGDGLHNTMSRRGKAGDIVRMIEIRNGASSSQDNAAQWDVLNVSRRVAGVAVNVDDTANCMRRLMLQIGTEWCTADEPSTRNEIVDYTDQCDGTAIGSCSLTVGTFNPLEGV